MGEVEAAFNPGWNNFGYREGVVGGYSFSVRFGDSDCIEGTQVDSLIIYDDLKKVRQSDDWIVAHYKNGEWVISNKNNVYVEAVLTECSGIPFILKSRQNGI